MLSFDFLQPVLLFSWQPPAWIWAFVQSIITIISCWSISHAWFWCGNQLVSCAMGGISTCKKLTYRGSYLAGWSVFQRGLAIGAYSFRTYNFGNFNSSWKRGAWFARRKTNHQSVHTHQTGDKIIVSGSCGGKIFTKSVFFVCRRRLRCVADPTSYQDLSASSAWIYYVQALTAFISSLPNTSCEFQSRCAGG